MPNIANVTRNLGSKMLHIIYGYIFQMNVISGRIVDSEAGINSHEAMEFMASSTIQGAILLRCRRSKYISHRDYGVHYGI